MRDRLSAVTVFPCVILLALSMRGPEPFEAPIHGAGPGIGGTLLAAEGTEPAAGIQFMGRPTFTESDANADGIAEGLIADVETEILTPGQYRVLGVLRKGSAVIANRPAFFSTIPTEATLNGPPGRYRVSLRFSGEQIFRSGIEGSCDLQLFAVGGASSGPVTFPTPAIDNERFGEIGASIGQVSEAAFGHDGDDRLDGIEVTIQLAVRVANEYQLALNLSKSGRSITDAGLRLTAHPGVQSVKLRSSGQSIRRAGLDGPFDGIVNLLDARSRNLESKRFTTRPYAAARFVALPPPVTRSVPDCPGWSGR